MPDKLTDNDIVKALECCMKICEDCENCPCINNNDYTSVWDCKDALSKSILDLINRLQGENEKLKKSKYIFSTVDYCADDLDKALEENKNLKAEAYKEFADKLKLHAYHECDITGYKYLVVQIEEIDNLLKELVGEDNESKN